MKNKFLLVEVLENNEDILKVRFIKSDIIMPVSRSIFDNKVRNGFYEVVEETVMIE